MQSRWILYFMLFSSVLLTVFVAFWLRESYLRARADLHERSDFVFNQAVRNAEDSLLRWRFKSDDSIMAIGGDSLLNIRIEMDTMRYVRNAMMPRPPKTFIVHQEDGKRDSSWRFEKKQFFDGPPGKDLFSAATIIVRATGGSKEGVDTMMVQMIERHFNRDATQNFPNISYQFKHFENQPETFDPWMTRAYFDPVSGNRLAVILTPTLWAISQEIWPQGLFSFILLFCIYGAFILSWRSLKRQEALTAMKDNFVSNMTHELKTPIATVSVALEALENFNVLKDPTKTAEYLDMSKKELSRLHLLVDQVLRTTSIEGNKIKFELEPVDLSQLTREILNSLKIQTDNLHATINLNTSSEHTVQADRMHLSNVLYNLVDNGLKYSKSNPELTIEIKESAAGILWSIADRGIGIHPDDQDRIFDKFYRVPHGNTHNVKGYGLGLHYVRQVMQMLHGSVQVESIPGQGSRFALHFQKNQPL